MPTSQRRATSSSRAGEPRRDDDTLALRVREGDAEAFALLVSAHTPRLLAVTGRITGGADAAEDAVQEAFLRFWRDPLLWNPDKGASFGTWIYRVAMNAAYDIVRKHGNIAAEPAPEDEYIAPPETEPENAALARESEERAKWLRDAVKTLPDAQQAALNLCFYEGMSNKHAAAILDVSVKALESLLIRGKQALRAKAAALRPKTAATRARTPARETRYDG